MLPTDDLIAELRQALTSLYDPTHAPPASVADALGLRPGASMQKRLLAEIESLRPGPDVPATARIRRLFDVLHLRYVEQWTQRRVADELGITVRHLAREQSRAIAFLADRLKPTPNAGQAEEQSTPGDRQDALHESLASLEHGPGQAVADLGVGLRRAVKLADVIALSHHVTLQVGHVAPGIIVAIRQTVLVQILVRALTQLITQGEGGEVRVVAREDDSSASITLEADLKGPDMPSDEDLYGELVRAQRGSVVYHDLEQGARIAISMPLATKRTVLVIDDNPDLIHYYRQCVANAPYEIVGVTEPERAVSHALSSPPDLIVLDLMMPDVDGYDILEQLQAEDALAGVPIIIASVISEQELALALGATLCLTKPVRRAAFLAGLDAALRAAEVRTRD